MLGVTGLCGFMAGGSGDPCFLISGDITEWTLNSYAVGRASFVATHTGDYPGSPVTYTPQQCGKFLKLIAGASTEAWSTASKIVTLGNGDSLSGWAAFDWRDSSPYVDGAKVEILDATGITVLATPWSESGSGKSDYWDGPWTAWNWTAPAAADYTIRFSARNTIDASPGYDSIGLFDCIVTRA